ncbi:hypothetical protein [Williamsia sp.]
MTSTVPAQLGLLLLLTPWRDVGLTPSIIALIPMGSSRLQEVGTVVIRG